MRPSRHSLHYLCYLPGLSEAIGETFPGERELLRKYAAGKWRLAEIIAHDRDSEEIDASDTLTVLRRKATL